MTYVPDLWFGSRGNVSLHHAFHSLRHPSTAPKFSGCRRSFLTLYRKSNMILVDLPGGSPYDTLAWVLESDPRQSRLGDLFALVQM